MWEKSFVLYLEGGKYIKSWLCKGWSWASSARTAKITALDSPKQALQPAILFCTTLHVCPLKSTASEHLYHAANALSKWTWLAPTESILRLVWVFFSDGKSLSHGSFPPTYMMLPERPDPGLGPSHWSPNITATLLYRRSLGLPGTDFSRL